MISPQPPRLRMNRRNTVSVTPAMGASTVAGAIVTPPMEKQAGTGCGDDTGIPRALKPFAVLSQVLRIERLGPNFHVCRPRRRKLVDLFEIRRIQTEALRANYELRTKFVSSILPNLNHSNSSHTVGRIQRPVGRVITAVAEQGQVLEMSRYPSNALDCIR